MISLPLGPVFVWLLVFLRVGFVLAFFPLVGERFVPARVRVLMAMVIALALAPVAPIDPAQFPLSIGGFVMLVLAEALLGFSIGFAGRLMFAIAQFSGQMAGEQMGFGMINAIDPTGSHQISVVAELMYLMAILIFLAADLHHGFLAVAADSFRTLPPGAASAGAGLTELMMGLGSTMFSLSLQLAMPVILIVFAINIGLGMIARAVPQINVFLESFPLRILGGLSIMLLSISYLAMLWENILAGMGSLLYRVMEAL